MTVDATTPLITYDYTGPGTYTFPFRIFEADDLVVTHYDDNGQGTLLVQITDYNVGIIQELDGGDIDVINPTTAGGTLEMRRQLPVTQEVDWVNNDPLDAEILEISFDRIIMILQGFYDRIDTIFVDFSFQGTWMPNTYYKQYNIVLWEQTWWTAKQNFTTGSVFDADNWNPMFDFTDLYQLLDDACQCATQACECADAARQSETNAEAYREQAAASEANAAMSETHAANCAKSAYDDAERAKDSADKAESIIGAGERFDAIDRAYYTATPGQTEFDLPGTAANYAQNIFVFMNSRKLRVVEDYTLDSTFATKIILNEAAAGGDEIDVISFNTFDASTLPGDLLDAANRAETAAELAEQYAVNPEDELGPDTGTFSALHYNAKAEDAKTAAEDARDLAEQYAEDAKSVACQDLASVSKVLSGLTDVADVFVYDTSLDSDGGAWRKRCQALSWYNETLNTSIRGATREFPALALIVASDLGSQNHGLHIYDMTDPDLPMWAIFNAGYENMIGAGNSPRCVTALNAVIATGAPQYDLQVIKLLEDIGHSYSSTAIGKRLYRSNIAGRNGDSGWSALDTALIIVDRAVNDVAMTVLDAAPVDDITGLPMPTIAVATDGGVSIIDGPAGVGTVVDMTPSSGPTYSLTKQITINKTEVGFIMDSSTAGRSWYIYDIPSVDVTDVRYNNAKRAYGATRVTDPASYDLLYLSDIAPDNAVIEEGAIGTLSGLTILKEDGVTPENGMAAYITDDYNTGWMHGDIKLATLSDTETGTLGFDVSTSFVENGEFDTLADWTVIGSSAAVVDNVITLTNDIAERVTVYQEITGLTGGKTYRILGEAADLHLGGSIELRVGAAAGDGSYLTILNSAAGPMTGDFVLPDGVDNATISFRNANANQGTQRSWGPTQMFEIGDEEIVGGVVDDEDGWTINATGWTISGGLATFNSAGGYYNINQPIAGGAIEYRTQFSVVDVRSAAGVGVRAAFAGVYGDHIKTVGIQSDTLQSDGGDLYFQGSNCDLDIDDCFCWVAEPELVVNGTFANWTGDDPDNFVLAGTEDANNYITQDVGGARLVSDGTSFGFYQDLTLEVGESYEITIKKSSHVEGQIRVGVVLGGDPVSYFNMPNSDANGTYSLTFKALDTSHRLYIFRDSTGSTDYVIENISVRKITNLVENGEFSSNRAWTNDGWTISNGVAAASGTSGLLSQNVGATIGKSYVVQMEITEYTSGLLGKVYLGGETAFDQISGVGVFTNVIHASTTGNLIFSPGAFNGSIDNVHVYEAELVNGNWQPVGNLIVNPGFEGLVDDAWYSQPGDNDGDVIAYQGNIQLVNDTSLSSWPRISQEVPTEAGEIYELVFDYIRDGGISLYLNIGTALGSGDIIATTNLGPSTAKHAFTFKAVGTSAFIRWAPSSVLDAYVELNNITVRKIGNLVENGEFSSDRAWTVGTNWAIANGLLTHTAGSAGSTFVTGVTSGVVGAKYIAQLEVSGRTVGNVRFNIGGTLGEVRAADGVYTEAIEAATTSDALYITPSSDFDGSVTNVRLYEAELVNGTYQIKDQLVLNPYFNGRFDETKWLPYQDAELTIEDGKLRVTNTTQTYGAVYQTISGLEVGRTYSITFTLGAGTSTDAQVWMGTTIGSGNIVWTTLAAGTHTVTFRALAAVMYLHLWTGDGIGLYSEWNDIYLKASQDVIENGEFSKNEPWTIAANHSITGGNLVATGNGRTRQQALDVTKLYQVTVEISANATGVSIQKFTGSYFNEFTTTNTGTFSFTFDPVDSNGWIYILTDTSATVGSISAVELQVADRSVNANHLQVVGEIDRVPVADGAELIGYYGFTEDNYIEQPYNSDLQFSTGDFYDIFWNYVPAGAIGGAAQVQTVRRTGTTAGLGAYIAGDSYAYVAAEIIDSSIVPGADKYEMVAWVRRSGELFLYVNGREVFSQASVGDVDNATAVLRYGINYDGGLRFKGYLTLGRMGVGAPSEDQIRHMYETEKHLFQEDAQATLEGSTTSEVLGISYDKDNKKVHALTTSGKSIFQGLNRVWQQTYTGVLLGSVDAHRNRVAVGRGDGTVQVNIPAFNLREELENKDRQIASLSLPLSPFKSAGIGQTAIKLGSGYYPIQVFDDGALVDHTVTFDGFYYYANIQASAGDVTVMAQWRN